MAVKKSDLYASLWASCDALRGGMDASNYKDYVLVLLFLKYISDKYAGQPYGGITVPPGTTFADLAALKGKADIGDRINKHVIAPLVDANDKLNLADFPDFNDGAKLGTGKEKVDRLTRLISIFQRPELDFSKNRADHDDLLGDAYEYLIRHFATESGKSKGQFYTPAEVSQLIAQLVGIGDPDANVSSSTTVYDPTCGSGSLLLKVASQSGQHVTLYGQEKDTVTSGLARMNMILHGYPTADIQQGNTLSSPRFLNQTKSNDTGTLQRFDYVVANPPFSDKGWTTGLDPEHDPHERFTAFGVPPAKQGDYAYLLHILASLKSTGTGACILPHGVLFRGNAEAAIREKLVTHGVLKAVIGLPANLFYGTGIPACILLLDKHNATARRAVLMIDASRGFRKDGPKNSLRDRDAHRIVDAAASTTLDQGQPGYARLVPFDELEANAFNLNLPRYLDGQDPEDIQDLAGHLQGGVPAADVDALDRYWAACPGLKDALFTQSRPGYHNLTVPPAQVSTAIDDHPQFAAFVKNARDHFDQPLPGVSAPHGLLGANASRRRPPHRRRRLVRRRPSPTHHRDHQSRQNQRQRLGQRARAQATARRPPLPRRAGRARRARRRHRTPRSRTH